jgi:hypothetical protein
LHINQRAQSYIVAAVCVVLFGMAYAEASRAQETIPAPPPDRTLVYILDERNQLVALPFETGMTPLRADAIANKDKTSYVEVSGASATTTPATNEPRLYLFVPDAAGVHPPFLVRFTSKRNARRVTAIAEKGLQGYAIASEEIVKPHYRVLARAGGSMFMEIRPREPLLPGEYGVLSSDLKHVATFRVKQ